MNIYGTKGALFLDGEEKLSMVRKTAAKHDISKKEELLSVPWISGSIWRAAFYRQINDFVNSICNQVNFTGSTFDDAVKNRNIMDQF